jgi:protein ImuB
MRPHWFALQPEPAAQLELPEALRIWAWRALRFTPRVAQVESALVLEVSASVRLFGGGPALLQAFLQLEDGLFAAAPHTGALLPAPVVAAPRLAQGRSALVALARLQLPPQPRLPMDALPVHTLAAARPHLATLTRLGVYDWGALRALPRGGLARRFGADLLDALDCAYGQRPERYPWLTLPEVFDETLELAAQVDAAPALLFGARRLLAQLQLWLRARQHGALALELQWQLDARRSNTAYADAHHSGDGWGRLPLRSAQASQDMRHWERLLAEQLARVTLPAPVVYLRLRAPATQALQVESRSLLPDEQRSGDPLHQMLERVAARLGPGSVLRVALQDDHRPECMQHWHADSDQAQRAMLRGIPGDGEAALYPAWLCASPQPLQTDPDGAPRFHGPLALLAGPQRTEVAGWDGDSGVQRDYFIARSAVSGLLWVFRQRLQPSGSTGAQWYLHGLFA